VLFISTGSGFVALCIALLARGTFVATVCIEPARIGAILCKSLVLLVSWTSTFLALKALPISIVAPIRSTSPLWTFLGALLLYRERPSPAQYAGIALTLAGCWLFSLAGKAEGLSVFRDRRVAHAFVAAISGAVSALLDKWLLQHLGLQPETVLFWYMGGLAVAYGVLCIGRHALHMGRTRFEWRWVIPCIGVLLVLSDGLFFQALSAPGTPISILSPIRRSSVIFTFLVGGAIFNETNLRRKGIALAFILAGVLLLCLS
jgi:transporter family protein